MHSELFRKIIEQPAKPIQHRGAEREEQQDKPKYPVIINGKIVRWDYVF